jgi:AcrR family transcriptional regulator
VTGGDETPLASPAENPPADDPAERESKGERTRRRLLDLAITQFGRHGYRSTSVSEITRAAGLTQAASYAYFDNKEALFRAAVDDDAQSLIRRAMAQVEQTPVTELIPALLVHLADGLDEHPLVRRVLAGQEPDAMDQLVDLPAMRRAVDEIGDRLAEGQREGTVRTDIDARSVARGAGAICLALLTSMTQGSGQSNDEVILGVLDVFNATVLPPA